MHLSHIKIHFLFHFSTNDMLMKWKSKQAHSSLRKHLDSYFTRKQQQTCGHRSHLNGGHAGGGATRLSDSQLVSPL